MEAEIPHKTETPRKCILKVSSEVKTFIRWWHLQGIVTRNNLLLYLSEEFYITEQKILKVEAITIRVL